jgi:glycosyltransferase involved in cell wall biosynthesis
MHEFPELLSLRNYRVYFFDFPERLTKNDKKSFMGTQRIAGRVYTEAKLELITPKAFFFGILQRIIATFTSTFGLILNLRKIKPDIIVTYAVPTYGLQVILIAAILNIPVIYRAIDVSHLIRSSKMNFLVYFIEGIVIRRSNLVSCNNLALKKYVESRGAKPGSTILTYAPINLEHFRELDSLETANLKNLVFLGTLFSFSGLDDFITQAFNDDLFKEGYNLTILGDGEHGKYLRRLVSELNLSESVRFLGIVPYEKLSLEMKSCGVALNPFRKSKLTDRAIPHKVMQYAASGKLIVSSPLEGLMGLFDQEESIFWAKDAKDMVAMIRKINVTPLSDLKLRIQQQKNLVVARLRTGLVVDEFESTLLRAFDQRSDNGKLRPYHHEL